MMDHPCFHCTLPDCDETSARCEIRVQNLRYRRKQRAGRISDVSELERTARAIVRQDSRLEQRSIAAERAMA